MAINNPYIPGDPYSYDLKWIVDKLKEAIALYEPLSQEFADLKEYVENYFANLDLSEEVQSIIDDMQQSGYFDQLVYEIAVGSGELQTVVTNWLAANVTPVGSAVVVDSSLSVAGAAADAAVTGGRTAALRGICPNSGSPYNYDCLTDKYIASGTPTTLAGYDTIIIPTVPGDVVSIIDSGNTYFFAPNLSANSVFTHMSGGTYIAYAGGGYADHRIDASQKTYFFVAQDDAICVSINRTYEDNVRIEVNHPAPTFADTTANPWDFVCDTEKVGVYTFAYRNQSQVWQYLGAGYHGRVFNMKSGDKVKFLGAPPTGFGAHHGAFTANNVTAYVDVSEFTAPSDGQMQVYFKDDEVTPSIYIPVGGLKIAEDHIYGASAGVYSGLSGVAFGTSLTQRAGNGYGYLNRLEALSGMTFDNQGVSSATLADDILPVISAYTDFATKDVAILEGFVNDWYQGKTLGSWTDTTTATVCGALYQALTAIQAANQYITVFLVLDHYGRLYNGTDESHDATNPNGLTQFQYYEELAKVAECMGVKVIKLYAMSGMNEFTPQYFADDIHVNANGEVRSGDVIWSVMNPYAPK